MEEDRQQLTSLLDTTQKLHDEKSKADQELAELQVQVTVIVQSNQELSDSVVVLTSQ